MAIHKFWARDRWDFYVPEPTVHTIVLDDESTDDQSLSLLAQLAAIPDGEDADTIQRIVLPHHPAGYRIDRTFILTSRTFLDVGAVDGEQFLMWTDVTGPDIGMGTGSGGQVSTRDHVKLVGCDNVVVRNIRVRGPNDQRDPDDTRWALWVEDLAFEHCYAMEGACSNCTFTDLEFTNVYGDGVYIGGTGDQNTDIVVRNVTGTYNGRQSMGIVNADGLLLEDIDIQWSGRSGSDIEPNDNSHFVFNVTHRRVTMGPKFIPFIGAGGSGPDQAGVMHVGGLLYEDCIGRNASGTHPAFDFTPADHVGGDITIRRHTDLRQRSVRGIALGGFTGTFIIEDSVISSGPASDPTCGILVRGDFAGTGTVENCTFNGPAGQAVNVGGADELFIDQGGPGTFTSLGGNTWNMGSESD